MVRVRINEKQPRFENEVIDVEYAWGPYWDGVVADGRGALFTDSEFSVVGKHAGAYDPEHWGEKDPDAYDRMGYLTNKGKHLLETGVN